MTQLSHTVMAGIALSLGLVASYFRDRYTDNPLILLRIFNYSPFPTRILHLGESESIQIMVYSLLFGRMI